jgi:hypothetical protein
LIGQVSDFSLESPFKIKLVAASASESGQPRSRPHTVPLTVARMHVISTSEIGRQLSASTTNCKLTLEYRILKHAVRIPRKRSEECWQIACSA